MNIFDQVKAGDEISPEALLDACQRVEIAGRAVRTFAQYATMKSYSRVRLACRELGGSRLFVGRESEKSQEEIHILMGGGTAESEWASYGLYVPDNTRQLAFRRVCEFRDSPELTQWAVQLFS